MKYMNISTQSHTYLGIFLEKLKICLGQNKFFDWQNQGTKERRLQQCYNYLLMLNWNFAGMFRRYCCSCSCCCCCCASQSQSHARANCLSQSIYILHRLKRRTRRRLHRENFPRGSLTSRCSVLQTFWNVSLDANEFSYCTLLILVVSVDNNEWLYNYM